MVVVMWRRSGTVAGTLIDRMNRMDRIDQRGAIDYLHPANPVYPV
jgi:hypothetical protein